MDDSKTLYCGNLSSRVTEEILYELFLQAGPLEDIILPKDSSGEQKSFAFVVFKHQCSVDYAIRIFQHTSLFERKLDLKPRERGPPTPRQQKNTNPIFPPQNPCFYNPFPSPPPFYPQQPFTPGVVIMTPPVCSYKMQQPIHQERGRCNVRRTFNEDGSYQDDNSSLDQRNDRREERRHRTYNGDPHYRNPNTYYNDSREQNHRHHYREPRRKDYIESSRYHQHESRRSDHRDKAHHNHRR